MRAALAFAHRAYVLVTGEVVYDRDAHTLIESGRPEDL